MPYVIGDFDWTAWDYIGETGIGKIITQISRVWGSMHYILAKLPTAEISIFLETADQSLIGEN